MKSIIVSRASLAPKINNELKKLGLKPCHLVIMSGLPKSTISKILAGKNTNPSFLTLWSISTSLGVYFKV